MVARVRVSINGVLGGPGGPESWSTGMHFGGGTGLSAADAQAVATDIAATLAGMDAIAYGGLLSLLSTSGYITDVDVYSYPDSGPANATGQAALATAKQGETAPEAPPQCCAVFSILTAISGASYRGRMYWPALSPDISASLKSSKAQGAGDGIIAIAAGITADLAPFGPYDWAVYSPTLDELTDVSSVRAGDVIDTQRRRRDNLVEVYTLSQYPA